MASQSGTLRVKIVGDDGGFQKTMSGIGGKLATFGKLAGAAVAGVGVAAVGAAVKGVQAFANLERGMNEVFTLLPGITQEAMDGMMSEVRQFSREFGVLPDEVVPALYQALSAGVPQDNVFEFMATATKASIGGVTDMETAVNGITSVVNNYGEDVIDAGKASDLMFTTVRLGKTDFEQLSASIGNILPFAAAAGVSFEDVSAAMASMTARTGKTAESSTQLRQLLVELADGGSSVAESFHEVAGVTFPEFIAAGGDMAGAMAILDEAAAASGVTVDQLFGSVEAGAGALLLTGENIDDLVGNLEQMQGAAGATDTAFKTMDEGLARSWDNLKVKFNDLFIELGERLAPAAQAFADWVEGNMPAILMWFEGMATKATEMGRAVWRFWNEDAKPALDEFVAAVQANWPLVRSIFDSLGRILQSVGQIFSKETSRWSGDTAKTSGSIADSVANVLTALERFMATAARVSEIVAGAWHLLAGGIKGDMGQIQRGLDDVSGGAFSRFTGRTRAMLDRVTAWFRALPGRIRAALGDTWNLLYDAGRQIIAGLGRGIRDGAQAAVDAVSGIGDRINARVRGMFRMQSPSKVFHQYGVWLDEGFAEGIEAAAGKPLGALGRLSADMALEPLTVGAMPGPASPAAAMSTAGSGGTVVNHYHQHSVTVNALDPPGAADAVMKALKMYERQNGPLPVRVA